MLPREVGGGGARVEGRDVDAGAIGGGAVGRGDDRRTGVVLLADERAAVVRVRATAGGVGADGVPAVAGADEWCAAMVLTAAGVAVTGRGSETVVDDVVREVARAGKPARAPSASMPGHG